MEKVNKPPDTSGGRVTTALNDAAAVGISASAAQQPQAQSPPPLDPTQRMSDGAPQQPVQQPQQQQQPVPINLQPGVQPQQTQQKQSAQQPTTWRYVQPAATNVPQGFDPYAQQLPISMPVAIPAGAAAIQQQQLRSQPVGNSPSSMSSSQTSPLANHSSTINSIVLISRAGSVRPDALAQQQQQPADNTQHGAASVQNSFKQRESAMAAAVATGGVDLAGSTAPLSLLGAVSTSQRFSAGGVSNKSLSPRASHHTGAVGITPQTSVQLAQLSRAASLATAGHTPTGTSKLRVQGRRHTLDSDDTDYSSSDNDDDYEYGEAKIKRTFTRQQRKQRKQQKEEQQLQQQAQQLLVSQQLQEQAQQVVQQPQAEQGVSAGPVSPHKHGRSEDGSTVSAAGTVASLAGSVHTAMQPALAGAAAVLGSSPQSLVLSGAHLDLLAALQQQNSNNSGSVLGTGQTVAPYQAGRLAPEGSFAVVPVAGSSGPLPQVSAGLLTAAFEGMQTGDMSVHMQQPQQQQQQQQAVMLQKPTVSADEAGMQQAAAAAAVAAAAAAGGSRGPSVPGVTGPGSIKAMQSDNGGEASFKDRFVSTSEGADGDGKCRELQTSPSELQAEFQGLSLFDDADDDDDNENEEKEARPLYRRPMVWFHLVAYFLSACLLFVGLGSQFIPAMFVVNKDGIQLFRWMYFFALWPMMWLIVNYVNNKVFAFVEWLYYLEALYALDSVRRNARALVFMCLVLPWFHICFWVIQCADGGCNDQQAYRQASGVVWKILVCLTLFSLANFLKSMTTKLLSTHFYRTAHFKKVKMAIEKEYYLLMLSQQRPVKPVETAAPLGALSQLVSYAGGHAGSVVANGSMQMVDKIRRMTLERGDTAAGAAIPEGGLSGDIKGKARASSFSGAELDYSHQLPKSLASKSISFFQAYQQTKPAVHDITATAALVPPPPPPTPPAKAAAGDSAPVESRLWGMRSARSQPWLQLQASNGGNPCQETAVSKDWQQVPVAGTQAQQLGLSPVRESSIAARVQLAEKSQKSLQELPQANSNSSVQHSSGKVRSGFRWGWWRPRGSQSESLLDTETACSSEYTIAIAGSPPTMSAASIPQQPQQGPVRVASQTTAATADSVSTGTVQRSAASTLRADLQSGSAFAAAAGTAAAEGSPRASMDSKAAAALHRGSAGARGGTGGQQGLTKSPSMAATAKEVVADPLLHTLEKVNVLGGKGKQVDAANIKPAEWERLRTGIALKTFTALMKRYQDMSDKEEAKKLREARRFAKGLFYNVRGESARPFLIRDDFAPFFPNKEQADQAYAYFDKDNDAQLTIKEMKDSVTAIFKERKNMAASLKDTDSIVKTLEFGIGFVFHFIFAAVYLLVWGLDILKGFSTFSATVLALTFVFGNSVRQIYESMLFLFVEHAFDVGDLLEVELVAYRVKKIDLMYTVLVKGTGERVYYPTTRLITLPVTNLTRSSTKSEKVVFNLDIGAASKKAREALLECVKEHYEENESDFNTCPSVNFVNLMDPFKVQLQVVWTYNFGADEHKRMSTAKTGLITAINDCLSSLDCLHYTLVKHHDARDSSSKPAAAAEHVQDMLESGQMQMTATGVPAITGVPTSAAAVVGAGGALGLLAM